jgi:hypothetical protein
MTLSLLAILALLLPSGGQIMLTKWTVSNANNKALPVQVSRPQIHLPFGMPNDIFLPVWASSDWSFGVVVKKGSMAFLFTPTVVSNAQHERPSRQQIVGSRATASQENDAAYAASSPHTPVGLACALFGPLFALRFFKRGRRRPRQGCHSRTTTDQGRTGQWHGRIHWQICVALVGPYQRRRQCRCHCSGNHGTAVRERSSSSTVTGLDQRG